MLQASFTPMKIKNVLHVGCGAAEPKKLHPLFQGPDWNEIRLDIDPGVQPDIVASLTDMHMIDTESVDAIYSSHNLEHLYPHEVSVGLGEFFRVLKKNGFLLISTPDLQSVASLIAADKLDEPAYHSSMGPIAPIDILYGFRKDMAKGNLFMAHKTGFTSKTLSKSILQVGFAWVKVARDDGFNLWAKAYKSLPDQTTAEGPMW